MRDGGDILALGKNIKRAMAEITADLPLGIEPKLVADQAVTVESAISEFMTSLWQAIAIILVVSFISLGVRPGLVIALAIPLTLAIVFSVMELAGIDMQRISLGALIIALALLVDDAMTTTDAMLTRLAQGDDKVQAATFAFRTYAFAMLAGTLVTIAGFVPVGFAASSAGEYTFSLFAVVAIALIVSWFVAVIFAPLLGVAILKPPADGADRPSPAGCSGWYRGFLTFAMRARWLTIALTLALFVASFLALPLIPRQFFPSSDRPELLVDLSLPQNASIYASETVAAPLRCRPQGRPGRRALEHLCRPRRHPLLSAAQCPVAERFLRPGGDRRQGCRGARAAAGEAGEGPGRRVSRASSAASIPLELGPPVGWPVQYRVSGPDVAQVREIAFKLAQVVATQPASRERQFRLDRAGAAGAHPRRPGRGAPAGPELAGAGRACSTRSYRAPPSPRCATTSIWSTSSPARPTSSASRSRPCAPCRCRCRTDAPFRSASSRRSSTSRTIR